MLGAHSLSQEPRAWQSERLQELGSTAVVRVGLGLSCALSSVHCWGEGQEKESVPMETVCVQTPLGLCGLGCWGNSENAQTFGAEWQG